MSSSAAVAHRTRIEAPHRRLTLLVMCVATFMIQLDVTVVNVALPRIQTTLDIGTGGLEWIIGAYALGLAAFIPAGGALGDHYGRKRVFLTGLTVFTLASVGCAVSSSDAQLIASRAVQGVGGAAMLALTLAIITETFPASRRAAAIGTWAAVGGTGFGVGPVAGGVLLTFFGWASVFWVNVPFAVVAIAGTGFAVRESRNPNSGRIGGPGVALSAAGLVALTYALVESSTHPWLSWPVAAPMIFGFGFLVAFGLWQRRSAHPMIPPSLLRARSFATAAAVYLISYTAFSSALFYVTLLYQDVAGWSVLRTGLSWLLMNLPFLLMAQLTGRLDRRFSGAAVVGVGCLTAAAGVLALTRASPSAPFVLTAAGYLLSGAGFGTLVPGITHLAMRDVPPGVSGIASGVLSAARQVGTSLGLAVLGSIGASAAVARWHARVEQFPAAVRAAAQAQAQNVGGARITTVTRALGPAYRAPAANAFVHGYHVALSIAAGCLLLGAVTAGLGFRSPNTPTGSVPGQHG